MEESSDLITVMVHRLVLNATLDTPCEGQMLPLARTMDNGTHNHLLAMVRSKVNCQKKVKMKKDKIFALASMYEDQCDPFDFLFVCSNAVPWPRNPWARRAPRKLFHLWIGSYLPLRRWVYTTRSCYSRVWSERKMDVIATNVWT